MMKPEEAWIQLTDIETGAAIRPHASSIQWNDYRKRWVMIVEQAGGSSSEIGEIWYAEADTPIGPWVYARKIVTHDKQSFYNPNHLSFFDQDGGRLIYFDGTYSADFSGNPEKTPRYEYNLIIYRLALDDARLSLPAPVYRVKEKDAAPRLLMREGVAMGRVWKLIEEMAFFAVPPGRSRPGLIPIFATSRSGRMALRAGASLQTNGEPLFFALPATNAPSAIESLTGPWRVTGKIEDGNDFSFDLQLVQDGRTIRAAKEVGESVTGTFDNGRLEMKTTQGGHPLLLTGLLRDRTLSGEWNQLGGDARGTWSANPVEPTPTTDRSAAVVALYEYEHPDGQRIYSTNPALKDGNMKRAAAPLCSVWRNPMALLILEPNAQPILPGQR
ncbi:MAG: DUF4185 domain-containing protein [Verrucomicrobiales bacterium]|nr:DUF4185 domain-containing protein [Verrucomicrobiales bacterium]